MSMMIHSLLLFAAAHSAGFPPAERSPEPAAKFAPTGGATARATASVRIVSGVSFGPGLSAATPGADRRHARIVDREGQSRSAELLEFQ